MKNIIAVTAVALSLSAPAFAQITDARAHFAALTSWQAKQVFWNKK